MPYSIPKFNNETILSPFAFPPDNPPALPMRAPKGQFFYLVTHPRDPKRKYFYHSEPGNQQMDEPRLFFFHNKGMAKKFDNLRMAECWAEFVCRNHKDADVFIILESER